MFILIISNNMNYLECYFSWENSEIPFLMLFVFYYRNSMFKNVFVHIIYFSFFFPVMRSAHSLASSCIETMYKGAVGRRRS